MIRSIASKCQSLLKPRS